MPEAEAIGRELLFGEFSSTPYDEWRKIAEDSLKGASFEKTLITHTYEGIDLQPIYTQAHVVNIQHSNTLPGYYPYVRGTRSAGHIHQPWLIAQELPFTTPQQYNAALRHDLERGQTAINLTLDDSHMNMTADDLAAAFRDMDLTRIPLLVSAHVSALPFVALLAAVLRQRQAPLDRVGGCIGCDPFAMLLTSGSIPLHAAYDQQAVLTTWAAEYMPRLDTIAVDTAIYHDSGANAVQELAFALATGVAYIRALQDRGLTIDTIARRMRFTFAVCTQFFMETAKLRAARMLWAQVVRAFGGDAEAQKMKLHIRTSRRNKTVYDPYVNMLRTTVEALAGAVGGCDTMHTAPFDAVFREPDEFSRRIARNQQIILQEEINLTRLIDPAGGSWYVESLTDQLARRAWRLFQEIERQGDMIRAIQSGFVQEQVKSIAAQRKANIESRRDILVGINLYANTREQRPDITHLANTPVEAPHAASLPIKEDDFIEQLIAAAQNGATLGELAAALGSKNDMMTAEPLRPLRLAEPFERLRDAAHAYRERTGTAPRLFLANIGEPAQYKGRTDFVKAFFEVGGFEILHQDSWFMKPEDAADAAVTSAAPVVVICSLDKNYPQIVPALVSQIKASKPETVLLLAGYPEAHQTAGVDDYVHIHANCYELNRKLQQQIGAIA